jgi:hypothetical protein
MRSLLKNNATLALGSLALLSLFADASAEPKDEVAAATSTWARALGEDDPDKVLPLYADDAVLWGTLSPTVRSDRSTVRTISWQPSRFCQASRLRSATN